MVLIAVIVGGIVVTAIDRVLGIKYSVPTSSVMIHKVTLMGVGAVIAASLLK